VLRDDCSTAGVGIVVDEVTAGCVIQHKSILLKETNNLTRFDSGEFRHQLLLYQLQILQTSGNRGGCGKVENARNIPVLSNFPLNPRCEKSLYSG
jgi:hypothetical protein